MRTKAISFMLVLAMMCTAVFGGASTVFADGEVTVEKVGTAKISVKNATSDINSMMSTCLDTTAVIKEMSDGTTTIAIKLVKANIFGVDIDGNTVGTVTAYAIDTSDGITPTGIEEPSLNQTVIDGEQIVELPYLSNPLGLKMFIKGPMNTEQKARIILGDINWGTSSLADGYYSVDAGMKKTTSPDVASSLDDYIDKPITVKVSDGNYSVILGLNTKGVGQLNYYPGGISGSSIQGDPVAADVLSAVTDENNEYVCFDYNDESIAYPARVEIPLVNKDSDDYIPVQILVPQMLQMMPAAAWQNALLEIDWSTLDIATKPLDTFEVSFDTNGSDSLIASRQYDDGELLGKLPGTTRAGFVFNGWRKSKDASDTVTSDTAVTSAMTLYASWEAEKPDPVVQHKVTFNANGGKASKNSINIDDNGSIGKLPTASRTDNVFLGWYTAKKGGTKITEKTIISKNMTVYAHWGQTAYVNIGKGKIKVRKTMSNKAKVVITIKEGRKVTVLSKSGKWAKVKVGSKEGYVKKSVLINQKTTKAKKKTVMRKSASAKAKKIMTVKKNKKATVIGSKGKWYKVKVGKRTGYVLKSTIK